MAELRLYLPKYHPALLALWIGMGLLHSLLGLRDPATNIHSPN